MPLRVCLIAICHPNAPKPKCTLQIASGRPREGEILEVYHELIDDKSTLRVGDTLVCLIFMSNGTHLSNFAGGKNECPVYITIGNQSLKIHQMPSMHSVVIVALLPIQIKNRNVSQKWLDE